MRLSISDELCNVAPKTKAITPRQTLTLSARLILPTFSPVLAFD